MLSPDALQPYSRNARTHSRKQIGQIAASIHRFGFTNPVLIDDDNMILAGHARVEAARQLGLMSVPCLRHSTLAPAEKRAYILADNKLALNAGWDEDLLAAEVADLDSLGVDLTLAGFGEGEIGKFIDLFQQGGARSFPDEAPAPPENPVTRTAICG